MLQAKNRYSQSLPDTYEEWSVMNMEQKKKSCCDSEELLHGEEAKKTAGNNQWTNNNLKYYPDERDRQDGPGGN